MDRAGLFELDGTPIEPAAPRSIPPIAWVFAGLAVADLVARVWPFLGLGFALEATFWAGLVTSSVRGVATVLLPAVVLIADRHAWRSHRPLLVGALFLAVRELGLTAIWSLGPLGVQIIHSEDEAFLWGTLTQLLGLALAGAVPWLLLGGLAPWPTAEHAGRTGRLPLVVWSTVVIVLEVLQILTAPNVTGRVAILWLVWSAVSTLALLGWAWLGLVGLALVRGSKALWSFALAAVVCSVGSGLALIVLGLVAVVMGAGQASGTIWLLPSFLDTAAILALLPTLALAAGKRESPVQEASGWRRE